MSKCPVMKAFTTKGKVVYVYCGQWSCNRCAKMLAKVWGWRVRIHIDKRSRQAYFWTFTMGSRFRTAQQGFEALPSLFAKLREVMRNQPEKWEYCAFVEGQPNRGYMPHFHIISLTKEPRRIKDLAVSCGFGYQATSTKVTSSKAGQYCAKYASKQSPVTPKGFRRVRTSHGWSKLPGSTNPDEYIVRSKAEHLWEYFLRVHELTGVPVDLLYDRWELGPYTPEASGEAQGDAPASGESSER